MNDQSTDKLSVLSESDIRLLKENHFSTTANEFLCRMQVYAAAIKQVRTKLEILDEEFSVRHDYNPIHHIESRLKQPRSIIEKLKRRGYPVSIDSMTKNLTDIAGVRVICNYIHDTERVANMLISQTDVTLLCRKDYITNPKPNGYRSLHVVVSVPVFLAKETINMPVEVQFRTIAMDFWASLEHRLRYKSPTDVPDDLRYRLKSCADDIARIDEEMQSIYKHLK